MRTDRSARLGVMLALLLAGALSLACGFLASGARVATAVMAFETQNDQPVPGAVTDAYLPEQGKFHTVVGVSDAPKNTKVKVVWTAPDGKVHQSEATVEGTRSVDLSVARGSALWTPGTYKADIYLDGRVAKSLTFKVVGVVPSTPTPTAAPPRATPRK